MDLEALYEQVGGSAGEVLKRIPSEKMLRKFVGKYLADPTFGNLESALYGLISLYCCSMVIDSIIYGLDKGSMVMVVSEKNDEIAAQIMDELERGVTLLKGQGAYTGTDRDVLMCAVRKQQFARVRAIIYEKDPNAFVIVSETSEVLGEGFKQVSGS